MESSLHTQTSDCGDTGVVITTNVGKQFAKKIPKPERSLKILPNYQKLQLFLLTAIGIVFICLVVFAPVIHYLM